MKLEGAKVRWIRGAVGLTGVCTGEVKELPDGGSLWEVQTDKGVFWEYSENLEVEG